MIEYEKDLNELKEQILKEGNTLVSKRDLVERFCEIDKEYNGESWNLLQILANINVLIGEESCEKAVSVQDCINAIENTDCELSPQAWREITNNIMSLPLVTPTQNWIPVSERLPEKDVEVLATTEWGEVTIAMYCVTDWLIHEGDTNAETDEIVAWMPLPKPYKTEMESEE